MPQILWVCLGGAVGSGARFALSVWCVQRFGTGFPWGTLAVNVIGSFLLGALMGVGLTRDLVPVTARLTLGTGVLGGFTTYSTFNYETLALFEHRAFLLGAANVVVTLLACFAAGWLGGVTAKQFAG